MNSPNFPGASPAQSLPRRLGTSAWYGAIAGLVFSGPGIALTFDNLDPARWLGGSLSAVVIFGLPAGLILGWLDSRKCNRRGWRAIVGVPAISIAGLLLLFGICAIPTTIDVLSRWGSELLLGEPGNTVLRRSIGALVGACFGACFGLLFPQLLTMWKQFHDWAFGTLPSAQERQTEQIGEPESAIKRALNS